MTAPSRATTGAGRPGLPQASWSAFKTVLNLHPLPPGDAPVDLTRLGLEPASKKLVRAALRNLGLVDRDCQPSFGMRRLVSQQDFTAVVQALAERFPGLMDGISRNDHGVLGAELGSLAAPLSSRARFYRFAVGAWCATGGSRPTWHPATPRPSARGESAGDGPDPAPLVADRQEGGFLEREMELYLSALRSALDARDLDWADSISNRLRLLRQELGEHQER